MIRDISRKHCLEKQLDHMRCSLGCIGTPAVNSDVQFLQACFNKEISLRVTQVNKARPNPLNQVSTVLQFRKLRRVGHRLSWLKERSVLSLNSAYLMELI